MRARLDQADGFAGLPRGTVKLYELVAAFEQAEPYLGLPRHAYKLIGWLVCRAANRMRGRIASTGMLPEAESLPHLICSRPMFIGGVRDEADQHDGAGRAGDSDSGAVFTGGQDGAGPYPRRVHGGYRLPPQARDAPSAGWPTEPAFWPATRGAGPTTTLHGRR